MKKMLKTTLFKLQFTAITLSLILFLGCTDHLDYQPRGAVSQSNLQNVEGAELLVTAAYASLGADDWSNATHTTNWLYGSVRSDDAYKGGGSTADQGNMDRYERFAFILTDMSQQNNVWTAFYHAIKRTNDALNVINELDSNEYPQKAQRIAEMRFIRAHNYFRLVMFFKNVPWIDETVPVEDYKTISNKEFTQDQLWSKIADEFKFAMENLPEVQNEVGRPTSFAAAGYLARTRLFQAFEQDENHNVVNVNQAHLNEVVTHTNYIINSGRFQLNSDYAYNFITSFDNSAESVFAVQHSYDDGTPNGRLNMAYGLNYNMSPRYGCCWFHVPSQNMINAFKTSETGTPLFDTFNDVTVTTQAEFDQFNFDPRISHTVGIPGHPYKYDPNFIYDRGWARAPEIYGIFSNMKDVQHPDNSDFRPVGSFFGSAKNTDIIRYDDILLMNAEALIELGRQSEALPVINQVRMRASNSTTMTKKSDGSTPLNYNVQPYVDGQNIIWTQENARQALRWERRLEFAMESWRFFDLVRWGIADEVLNSYFETERERRAFLQTAMFTKNRNEYLPIPQQQIDLSEGLYIQNPGY